MAESEGGKLWFSMGLDNSQLQTDAQRSIAIIRNIGNAAEAEGSRIDNLYRKIVGFGSGFLVLQHAKSFIDQMIKVRGEVESLSISFETLLGNKQKADALFSQIKDFAAKTPMELTPLAKGAQTLLSFNVEAEKVMPILKQIGDLSMGSSDKFNSLVLAFSQMHSTGKLMGQDLLQMINAGFNPLTVMAEKTGKSIAQLKEEMSSGAITADMVADAFRSATEEGGKFHGMLDKQSKGINGSFSNLKGAIDDMMNDLGTKSQGLIASSIAGATTIVQHYEQIGKVIMDIVVAYGAYKAAVMTVAAVQKIQTGMQYASEIAELSKLIPAKKQSAFADIEAAVASGKLTQAKAEQLIAIRLEINAKLDELKTNHALAASELETADTARTSAVKKALAVRSSIAAKQAELLQVKLAGDAKRVEILEDELAVLAKERETAAMEVNNASKARAAAQSKLKSASTAVDTMTTDINTASQTANGTATNILAAAKLRLVNSIKAVTAAMSANPYILVAAAVAALVLGIYKLVTAETAAETAQRKHNEAMEAAREKKENLISKTQQLINKINDETQTVYTQIKAWKELQKEMPEAFASMTLGDFKNMKPEEIAKLINQAVDDKEIKEAEDQLNRLAEYLDASSEHSRLLMTGSNDQIQKSIEKLREMSKELKEAYPETKDFIFGGDNSQIKEYVALLKQAKVQRDEDIKQAEYENATEDEKLAILKKQYQKYQEQYDEIEKLVPESERIADLMNNSVTPAISNVEKGLFDVNTQWSIFGWQLQENISQLGFLQGKMNEVGKKIQSIKSANGGEENYAKAKAKAKKNFDDANKLVDDIAKNEKNYTKKAYEDAVKDLEEKKKTYQSLGGETTKAKTQPKSQSKPRDYTEQIEREKREMARAYKDLELSVEQARIDAMKEGHQKILDQNKLNYDKEIEQIKRQKEDFLKKIQDNEKTVWESEHPNREKKGEKFVPQTVALSEKDEKQFKELDTKADEKFKNANKKLLDDLVEKYQTYDQKRRKIEEEFGKELTRMQNENVDGLYDKNIEELKKKWTAALAVLDNEEFSGTKTAIDKLFGDMTNKSAVAMQKIADQAKAMIDFIKGGEWNAVDFDEKGEKFGLKTEAQFKALNEEWSKSPEKLEAVEKGVKNLGKEADQAKMAFDKMSAGLQKIFNPKDEDACNDAIKNIDEGLGLLFEGFRDATAMGNLFADSLRNIGELSGGGIFSSIADGLSQVMEVGNSAMQGAQAGAAFGPAGAAVGAALGFVSSVTGIFSENKKHREELKKQIADNQMQAYLGELEINRLYRERYEWAKKIGEATLRSISRQGEELKKQAAGNARDQDDLWKNLLNTQFKVNEHFKKTGLFGWGKGKIVTEWASLAGKTWEDIEKLAAQGKLSEEGQKYYEALKKAKEEGDDLAKRQEEFLETVKETFTGTTYDSVVNGIIDGFKAGKRSAADFADTFENLMQSAVSSSLKMMAEEKVRQFYEDFAEKAQSDNMLTERETGQLQTMWDSILNGLAAEKENLQKITGITMGDSAREASKKGFASMSQDSADELNGRFTAFTALTYSISENTKILVVNSGRILQHLAGIESNTRYCERLEGISNDMRAVKNGIETMNLKGVILKAS
ncbi:MAG: tape measure protein [Candidatus Azobacteroides sp.]|nr:tape measure protein [Candidatus Azobacteroides sp.]